LSRWENPIKLVKSTFLLRMVVLCKCKRFVDLIFIYPFSLDKLEVCSQICHLQLETVNVTKMMQDIKWPSLQPYHNIRMYMMPDTNVQCVHLQHFKSPYSFMEEKST